MYNSEVYVLTNPHYLFLFLIWLLLQESQPRHREQQERLFFLPYTLSLSLSSNHSKDLDAIFFFLNMCGSDRKEFTCSAGDPSSIPELGRSPREGNGYLLQYSCLKNPIDRGAWQATVHGIAKNRTWLSDFHIHTLSRCIYWSLYFYCGFTGSSHSKESAAVRETWVQSLGWEDPLEKGMATHSSILAWKIPWTEEPGGL